MFSGFRKFTGTDTISKLSRLEDAVKAAVRKMSKAEADLKATKNPENRNKYNNALMEWGEAMKRLNAAEEKAGVWRGGRKHKRRTRRRKHKVRRTRRRKHKMRSRKRCRRVRSRKRR